MVFINISIQFQIVTRIQIRNLELPVRIRIRQKDPQHWLKPIKIVEKPFCQTFRFIIFFLEYLSAKKLQINVRQKKFLVRIQAQNRIRILLFSKV
jgi:hypothetical protein